MAINARIQGYTGCISMSGSFDFKVHRDFKNAYTPLLDNPVLSEIDIEMSKLDFIDSSGLGMLMLLKERAHATKKSVSLLNASGTVMELLEVANFIKLFNFNAGHDCKTEDQRRAGHI